MQETRKRSSTPTPTRRREGFAEQAIRPDSASYSSEMGEFVLPYDALRRSASPDADLLAFFQSTYEAAAATAQWDRGSLEWDGPER